MGKNIISILVLTLTLNLIYGLPLLGQTTPPKSGAVKFFADLGKALKDTSDVTGHLAGLAKTAEMAVSLLEPVGLFSTVLHIIEKNLMNGVIGKRDNLTNSILQLQSTLTDVEGIITNPIDVLNRATGIINREIGVHSGGILPNVQKSIEPILNILIPSKPGTLNITSALKNINEIISKSGIAVTKIISKVLGMIGKSPPQEIINTVVNDLKDLIKDVNNIIGMLTGTVGGIGNNTNGILNNTIVNVTGNLTNVVGSIPEVIGNLTTSVGAPLNNITGNLGNAVESVTGSTGNLTSSVGNNVTSNLGSALGSVNVGNVTGNLTNGVGSIPEVIGNLTTSVGAPLSNVTGNYLGSVVGSLTGSTGNLTSSVGNNVTSNLGSALGSINNTTAGLRDATTNVGKPVQDAATVPSGNNRFLGFI